MKLKILLTLILSVASCFGEKNKNERNVPDLLFFEGVNLEKDIKEIVSKSAANVDIKLDFRGPKDKLADELSEIQKKIDSDAGLPNSYYEFSDPVSGHAEILMIVMEPLGDEKFSNYTLIIHPSVKDRLWVEIVGNITVFLRSGRMKNLRSLDRSNRDLE